MRIQGLELRDSHEICVWWIGGGEHRAIARVSAAHRTEIVDRLLERLPGGRVHGEHLQATLSELLQPGRSVALRARGFDHWIGLSRPFALGELDSTDLMMVAAARAGQLNLPLLTASTSAARAFARLMNSRCAGPLPWQRFTLEDAQDGPFSGAAAASGRAPMTELEGLLAATIQSERADRARMIDHTRGEKHICLAY